MKNISAIQETILLTQNIYINSPLYNVGGYALIEGALQTSVLIKSIKDILDNADAIVIGFQCLHEDGPENYTEFKKYSINSIDFSTSNDPVQSCLDWMNSDIKIPFESNEKLLQVNILKADEQRYYWYTKVHHLVFDGYAMSLFFNKVSILYSLITDDSSVDIIMDNFHYMDFIRDEDDYRLSDNYKNDKDFWLKRLNVISENKAFHACMKASASESLISNRQELTIPRSLYESISFFCQRYNCTVFHYFLTTLIILNRCYNEGGAVIGIPVYNRKNKKFKNTLGTFVNILPFNDMLIQGDSFIEVLVQVKNEIRECYKHQHFPLYEILQELDRPGNIYNVSFSYQKNDYKAKLGDTNAVIQYLHNGAQQEDLVFHLLEYSATEDLTLSLDYKLGTFSDDVIHRLLGHFNNLLHSFYDCPNKPLKELDYLPAEEKSRLLVDFNDTFKAYADQPITAFFESQAARTPDHIALVFEGHALTYQELNEQSNQFAAYLRSAYDIQAGDLAGILLERSEELIVCMLGILKSGAAYVPVDPDYPEERIAYILADSQCRLLIDDAEMAKFRSVCAQYDKANLPGISQSGDLAYVIYTSGSTGHPKGVMIEHRNASAFIDWCIEEFSASDFDTALGVTSICFDLSVFEIFYTLSTGKKIRLLPDALAIPLHLNTSEKILLNTVPSVVANLLNEKTDLSCIGVLNMAGEPVPYQTIAALDCHRMEVRNLYGPSEDTTYSTVCRLWDAEHITIGKPIANTRIYILNQADRLQPEGVVGEICISGAGLARGYLNKEALSAERFVADPFVSGERMYRTGDLGRWLSDGNIEFSGRKDDQIKIRGYRIELGEIETVLELHGVISAATVVVKTDAAGDKCLVAYVVSADGLDGAEMRSHLLEKLPAYMVPAYFVRLEALPLTPNGKVDKRALLSPDDLSISSGTAYVAPRNEIEERLAELWQQLLGRNKVGVKDNFFEIGGHSLKATRLIGQIHKTFEVKITIKELFATPVLEKQASFIQQAVKDTFMAISPLQLQSDYVLSSSQRRLWLLNQFEEGRAAYNMPAVYVFDGNLDFAALTSAFNSLLERHEILRTVFKENEHGEVRQVVQEKNNMGFNVNYQDLRTIHEDQKNISLLIKQELTKPFDLAAGPLVRAGLYQLENHKWLFTYVMHHIISDGWSMNILIKELVQFYNAYTRDEIPVLSSLRIQYKDYASWQQDQLIGENLTPHRNYWLKQFMGELPIMQLPGDQIRPLMKTFNGNVVTKTFAKELVSSIKKLTKQQDGTTLFMGLLAGVNALLYRYTGQEDQIIGSPIAGREHIDLEDQIGFYVNTLALRSRFKGTGSFRDLLAEVKQVTLGAYEHQVYPFDELIDALELHRDMSRSALFDVMVVLQNNERKEMSEQHLGGLTISNYEEDIHQTSKFDLTFSFVEAGDEIRFSLRYNSDIFAESTALRFAEHLIGVFEAIAENPDQPLAELDYLSAKEKDTLLVSFNNTDAIYPSGLTLKELFENQVKETPGHTAVVFEETAFTYEQLNEYSNQLADYLRKTYEIQAGEPVVILLERSEWMIAAVLGVLKSGGAYVPVDPDYPAERIAYIIADSQCRVVLDDAELARFKAGIADYEKENQLSVSQTVDLAYIIYTSGTSGQPKGVMIEQHSLVNYLFAMRDTYGMTDTDRVLQLSNFAFDASAEQIFLSILNGATLYLVSRMQVIDTASLGEFITSHQITHLHTVPTLLTQLELSGNNSLRRVISAGEHFPLPLLDRFQGHVALYNKYGPTEATISSAIFNAAGQKGLSAVPIGRPVANTKIYILNDYGHLQPVGIIGELCIGGAGLARGYLNKEALSAEKFVISPYTDGQRMYRTGDLARWLPDGNIEFIGRQDDQVKIRGYRIELGEIENVLLGHQQIESAAVAAREDSAGEMKLVAYIVSKQNIKPMAVKEYLTGILPAYMVPLHYIILESLPLTANGKIDKKALPDPEGSGMASTVEYVAPGNEEESRLVQIWALILGLSPEKISVKDNFFDIGGHSLKATRLVSQIHKEFDVRVSLKELFAAQLLEEQAHLIQQAAKTSFARIPVMPLQIDYALSSSQRRLWVMSQFGEGSIAYHMPAVCIFEGDLNRTALELSFTGLLKRHEILRTSFRENEQGEIRQVILQEPVFNINYQDLRGFSDQDGNVENLVKQDLIRPFDLAAGPLVRAGLYQMENHKWVFTYTMHHIISDGWSMGILIKELLLSYNSIDQGKPNRLAPLRVHYKDYAAWQQDQLQSDAFSFHRKYWLEQFSGELPVLNLQGDLNRPLNKTYNGSVIHNIIDKELVHGVKLLIQEQGGTLFMGLLAAVNVLLYRYSGQDDLIVGSPIAGREHADLEDQIGFYVNTLALRSRFKGTDSFKNLLGHVKQVAMDAYEHQMYPFDELVDALQLQRDRSRSPLFDVMIILQNNDAKDIAEQQMGDLTVKNYEGAENQTSKFDLTFNFAETSEGLGFSLIYNSDIFTANAAARLSAHLEQLIYSAVHFPDQPLKELDYLSSEEKSQLLVDFNDTFKAYPDQPITAFFEAQAAKTPDHIAVVFQENVLTYQQLNEQSNQFAAYLRSAYDIQAGDLVGILLERSEELIVCMLGVLKSGAAYVPVDPDYPEERIAYIIADSQCKLLIDQAEIEKFKEVAAQYDKVNLPEINQIEDLAYVIYTSGSTGHPKGVMIEHRNVSAFIHWCIEEFSASDFDTVLGVTSICFDLSVFEIFYTLSTGKKIRLLPDALAIPLHLNTSEKILLNTVPSVVANLLKEKTDFSSINVVNMCGEPVTYQTIAALDCHRMEVRNLYGPSEDTVYSTVCRLWDAEHITIGKPIANTRIYILNEADRLQSEGVIGEICISGAGLARGYLNREALSAERFVADTFVSGERMYRTGDLGRWLSDGNIEFAGRKDDQIKIRGYRIELGEIETVLELHGAISAATVVVKTDAAGDKSLVAYVVSADELDGAEIRSHLLEKLPAYMVPAYFVRLEVLPLTPNGKVDKRALPSPDDLSISSGTAYVAPRNEIEEKLTELWQQLLGRNKIGVKDNFFEIGGHSLKATQLISRINKEFNVQIALKSAFLEPTIEVLAEKITNDLWLKDALIENEDKYSEIKI